jgi:hypothetical protein
MRGAQYAHFDDRLGVHVADANDTTDFLLARADNRSARPVFDWAST